MKNNEWIQESLYTPLPLAFKITVITLSVLQSYHRLHMAQCHQSDGDTAEVFVLPCNSVAQNKDYTNHIFISSQTLNNNYNQSQQTYIPPPLDLCSTTPPAQAELSSPPFRGVIINKSYNLIMQTMDQQSFSGPELQVGPYSEKNPCGYQPQSVPETFTLNQESADPESPVSCVTTYILCP